MDSVKYQQIVGTNITPSVKKKKKGKMKRGGHPQQDNDPKAHVKIHNGLLQGVKTEGFAVALNVLWH